MVEVIREDDVLLNKNYYNLLKEEGLSSFDSIMDYGRGKLIKKSKDVSVHYLRFPENSFYLKRYRSSFESSIEPLLKLKHIDRDGVREWDNIWRVWSIGINTVTPVAAGRQRDGLLRLRSFLLTEELYDVRKLDEYFRENLIPPYGREKIRLKRAIIYGVAAIVRKLHENRLSHQDLYLGHFYIAFNKDSTFKLYLIDLQRIREASNEVNLRRHRIKDLAQLLFASHYEVFVSNLDRLRFYKTYVSGRHLTETDLKLFKAIHSRAGRIAEHTKKHGYPLPAISWQPQL